MKFAGFISIEVSVCFMTGTGDYSERFETREFIVSYCWQVIRSNLFNEKVELENFASSVATLAGFVFIGVLYTRRDRENREIIPARFLYLQPVLRTGKSTREFVACVSPF